jgi:hypothetical protein
MGSKTSMDALENICLFTLSVIGTRFLRLPCRSLVNVPTKDASSEV